MPIAAFITDKAPVPRILNPIGEPSMAPLIALRVELRRVRATNPGPAFSMNKGFQATPSPNRSRRTNSISPRLAKHRLDGCPAPCCLFPDICPFAAETAAPNACACPTRPSSLRTSPWTALNGALTGGSGRWIFRCRWLDFLILSAAGVVAGGRRQGPPRHAPACGAVGRIQED